MEEGERKEAAGTEEEEKEVGRRKSKEKEIRHTYLVLDHYKTIQFTYQVLLQWQSSGAQEED